MTTEKHGFRYCLTCSNKLQKRGLTAAGTQRWFCAFCKASATKPRADLRQAKASKDHSTWLLGKQTQKDFAAKSKHSARSFRRKTAWCWNTPSLARSVLTGEIHHAIIIDGIRIGSGVCLIARATKFIVGWAWVPYESNAYWTDLLSLIPPPAYVICDGQKGMLLALKTLWPQQSYSAAVSMLGSMLKRSLPCILSRKPARICSSWHGHYCTFMANGKPDFGSEGSNTGTASTAATLTNGRLLPTRNLASASGAIVKVPLSATLCLRQPSA